VPVPATAGKKATTIKKTNHFFIAHHFKIYTKKYLPPSNKKHFLKKNVHRYTIANFLILNWLKRNMKIDSVRNEYNFPGISRRNIAKNPFEQFEKWMEDVLDSEEKEPTAITLSTLGSDGFPRSRIVLLKFFDENGFVFFTNYNSEKGKAIEENQAVGLHFYWSSFERQIHISGFAEKTSREISEKYFHSRPVESQISAWASEQSEVIPSREYLEKRFEKFSKQFDGELPPLPPDWGGYRVVPQKIEFWQGRVNRLHDRILYEKTENGWDIKRLAP
jgi:pyridoxamine 5'-phosphate oxidase